MSDELQHTRTAVEEKREAAPIAGRYQVEKVLGSGGMGEVYLVADLARGGERIALKKLFDNVARDEKLVGRFKQEVEIASKFTHPNIIQVYEFGEVKEPGKTGYFYTMEFVEGKSLKDLIYDESRGFLRLYEVVPILLRVCGALHYAHTCQVVHRDLKPDNILFTTDETIKLTDFGIARSLVDDRGLTGTNEVVGTPFYMSPEQLRGDKIDGRSDIYALGILAYEMVTRKHPFDYDNFVALASAHFRDEIPRIHAINPDVPTWYQDFVDTCCEKKRDDRFESMLEVAETLMAHAPKETKLPSAFDLKMPIKDRRPGIWDVLTGAVSKWFKSSD